MKKINLTDKERERRILYYLRNVSRASRTEIFYMCHIGNSQSTKRVFVKLLESGKIVEESFGGEQVMYRLNGYGKKKVL